ncbi:MAG: phosphatidylglycerol lysyltransferase domain-containing protein [Treponema sp.]|nr:phosphatidylglycerol lysyltransferase domain-containing protein [Treponema sp.]
MSVPCYPDFTPLSLDIKNILHPRLSLTADGVSEFTFSGLYLFRNRYHYRVSRIGPDNGFIVSGEQQQKKFFMTPCEAPDRDILESLFATHDYWKNIPETVLESSRQQLDEWGIAVSEDRNNFAYLYFRSELAELAGKKFHKKKNLVNQFLHTYSHEERPLTRELIPLAIEILDQWRQDKAASKADSDQADVSKASVLQTSVLQTGVDGDYAAAREALELFDSLPLRGYLYFADGRPAAYCLGESVAKGKMFAIHFEKAIDHYKGMYQFMNQAFAAALPRFFINLNREQDLGDEGLRQAKMTYRPSGFVKKYTALPTARPAAVQGKTV